ncbi:hemoglobin embryonic subunit alpha-like [Thunnus thynnus]|uniref:hemoglobin embryonic subunit alpha-like n=1 Tax=Thunnus thynnus TaxID=8237 RepID=UPI0035282A3E
MTSLTAKDKANVKAFWDKVSSRRTTSTKTYFVHLKDLSPGSANVRKYGRTIMARVADALTKIDDLKGGLLSLSELHALTLRVDPANFKVLSQSL